MNLNQQPIPAGDERLAGSLMNVVLKLQKNRQRGFGSIPINQKEPPQEGAEVLSAVREEKQNEQEKNATGAPGVFPKEGGEEGGRKRNVRQGEAESSSRKIS